MVAQSSPFIVSKKRRYFLFFLQLDWRLKVPRLSVNIGE